MKTYTLSFAAAQEHTPKHPDRTVRRENRGLNFDVTFKEFPSRAAMLKTIQMQDQREPHHTDWKPVQIATAPAANPARQALTRAVNRAIASGSPVYTCKEF